MDKMNQENLLIKYYDGNATEEEVREIEAWIRMSDENYKKAKEIYTLLLAADTKLVTDKIDMEKELSMVKAQAKRAGRCIFWWKSVQRFAAIMFIPMAITIFLLLSRPAPDSAADAQILEVRTLPGMVTSFRLPDSTLVYLNSSSSLRYPSVFTGDTREVSLSGEAYFDVTKNPDRKFIISTSQNSKVEVLGTRFNLEAFDDMDEVITTLVEGKVEFVYQKADSKRKMVMNPGQKIVYNKKDGHVLLKHTSGESELSWKDMKVVFNQTPLADALHMLEKRYNVKFIVKTSEYEKYTFTGTFTDQYVEEILENFKISSGVRWRSVKAENENQRKKQIEIY
jgi:Fe2+-dicitrate sensor, membrane component